MQNRAVSFLREFAARAKRTVSSGNYFAKVIRCTCVISPAFKTA
jgi:hypothetical protein